MTGGSFNTREHPADPDTAGQAKATRGRHQVRLWWAWDFRDHDLEDQRETVVHELLHAHLAGAQHMVLDDLDVIAGNPVSTVF